MTLPASKPATPSVPRVSRDRNPASEQPTQPMAAEQILFMGLWFALLTGLGEIASLAVSRFVLKHLVFQGIQVLWMAPLAHLLLFGLSAGLLFLAARRWPNRIWQQAALVIFSFLLFVSLLFMIVSLHRLAAMLLAAGLAVQTARLAAAHPNWLPALMRLTFGWPGVFWRRGAPAQTLPIGTAAGGAFDRRNFLLGAGTTLAALVAGAQGWPVVRERRALARLPSVSPDRPNLLLLILDTVRAPNLSLHGYARRTSPRLEEIAQNGVRFERAVASAPWTLASHSSFFTGRHPHELSADQKTALDATYPTLAEVLSAEGYHTAGFVGNTIFTSAETGLNRGFAHYEDFLSSSIGQTATSISVGRNLAGSYNNRRLVNNYQLPGRKNARQVNEQFLSWLARGRDPERPFFAFLNYFDAHDPYLPSPPYETLFAPKSPRGNVWLERDAQWTPELVQAEMNAYDGAIAYLDDRVGRLMDELGRRGVMDNTLLIIASDHGEEFYEHGVMAHGTSLYWPSLHVPLMTVFPASVPAGAVVNQPASLRDLSATALDLLQIENATLPGRSLARFWNGAADPGAAADPALLSEVDFVPNLSDHFPLSKGDMKAVLVGRYHYILNGDGREELYDIEGDPWEAHDLAQEAASREVLEQSRGLLQASLQTPTRVGA